MIQNPIVSKHIINLENAYIERTATNLDLRQLSDLSYIRSYAFYSYSSLKSILLPRTITDIGKSAFMGAGITRIDLMFDNLCNLQYSTFYSCTSLVEVHLSNCNIVHGTFDGCIKLDSFYIHDNNPFNTVTRDCFYMTPITDSSYLGHYGSIYVPRSLFSGYYSLARSEYKERLVAYDY